MNSSQRQFLGAASIGDGAVPLGKLAVDFRFVPSFSVTDINDAEVVLLGPEERDRVETLPQTKHVARGGLALALGNNPVLDADSLASTTVWPARDVTGREDARSTRLQDNSKAFSM